MLQLVFVASLSAFASFGVAEVDPVSTFFVFSFRIPASCVVTARGVVGTRDCHVKLAAETFDHRIFLLNNFLQLLHVGFKVTQGFEFVQSS